MTKKIFRSFMLSAVAVLLGLRLKWHITAPISDLAHAAGGLRGGWIDEEGCG